MMGEGRQVFYAPNFWGIFNCVIFVLLEYYMTRKNI